jgi:hypothetical protein
MAWLFQDGIGVSDRQVGSYSGNLLQTAVWNCTKANSLLYLETQYPGQSTNLAEKMTHYPFQSGKLQQDEYQRRQELIFILAKFA